MNEQIKKIVEETYVDVITTRGMTVVEDGCYIVSPDRLEKYTYAVVKECLERGNILAKHYIDNFPEQEQVGLLASIADYSSELKRHFGIEE
jgi:predicted aconitase